MGTTASFSPKPGVESVDSCLWTGRIERSVDTRDFRFEGVTAEVYAGFVE